MRVAFFEPTQETLTNHRKGELFEHLTRRLVEASGYGDILLRQKHNSLEYDIEAKHALHGTALAGEAKALDRNVDGKELAAFVGKLLPLAARRRTDGLFISVSPMTPDASDYLEAVTEGALPSLGLSLTTLVGDEIPRFLRDRVGHISEEAVRSRLRDMLHLETADVWLVVTEREDFFVATCGPTLINTPTHFVALKTDGSDLSIGNLGRLQGQVKDLAGLALASGTEQLKLSPRSERLPSIDAGAGWFDYRFPAPPECFIGREPAVEEVSRALSEVADGNTSARAIQILSRSGVGKSSLLLKLGADLPNTVVVATDARGLRVPSELRLLIADLADRVNRVCGSALDAPRTQDESAQVLEAVGKVLTESGRVGVIQLDQSESTLALPAVFAGILDLLAVTTSRSLPIVWLFARKNDLSVTFDEGAAVDLDHLNNQSRRIRLEDFSPPESSALLERLSVELGKPLRPGLAEAIATFSAGFPWLHKRLCAHVLSMQNEGVSQDELLQQGLRAEDLFEEDMAGLGEADRALLRRLAAHLPATGSELARILEAEVSAERLRVKLNEFLGQKLLRLSGDVYDTYNDVFKTYLVTEQVPFQSRYIFRGSPKAALDLLPEIAEAGPASLANFQRRVGGRSRIALINKLRELRLLGLISSERGRVALTPEAQAALEAGRLGELLRARLRGNALVVRVLDVLASEDAVPMDELARDLRRELPHVRVEETTWRAYARQLAAWLDFSGLAYLDGDALRLRDFPTDETLRGRDFYAARFVTNTFMPSVRPGKVVELMEALRGGGLLREEVYGHWGDQIAPGLLRDAAMLDLVKIEDGTVEVGYQGEILLQREQLGKVDVAQLALTKPNVKALVDAISDAPLSDDEQREAVSAFGSANWTDATWHWRLGILRAWVVATGHARSKRGGLVQS